MNVTSSIILSSDEYLTTGATRVADRTGGCRAPAPGRSHCAGSCRPVGGREFRWPIVGQSTTTGFPQVVQQGRECDFLVHVVSLRPSRGKIFRGSLNAPDDLQNAQQGLRLAAQPGLDRHRCVEAGEKEGSTPSIMIALAMVVMSERRCCHWKGWI